MKKETIQKILHSKITFAAAITVLFLFSSLMLKPATVKTLKTPLSSADETQQQEKNTVSSKKKPLISSADYAKEKFTKLPCSPQNPVIDKIRTAFLTAGIDGIVIEIQENKLLATCSLVTSRPSREILVKISAAIGICTQFMDNGLLSMVFFHNGIHVIGITGSIDEAKKAMNQPDLWPEYLKSLKIADLCNHDYSNLDEYIKATTR